MTLTNINSPGGPGLYVGGVGFLTPFVGDATKEITAIQVPEPVAILLALCFSVVPMLLRRR